MAERQSVLSEADRTGRSTGDVAIEARILVEYDELPGLSLTLPQAARLFDLDMTRCAHLPEDLVHDGRLWTNGHAFLATRPPASRAVCSPPFVNR